jgi:fumarylacetoacetate (FAA) hydrolase
MKLVTYAHLGEDRHGVLVAGSGGGFDVIDVRHALAAMQKRRGATADEANVATHFGRDMLGLIERADVAMPELRAAVALAEKHELSVSRTPVDAVTLRAPIPRPPSMRDGYAFRQHVETARRNRGLEMIPEFDQFPIFYFTNHFGVVGPGEVPVMPLHLQRLDFELEAAVVVGKRGRNLSPKQADESIFGMTIMNDLSARVLQMEEMKLSLGPAKGKDFATALGPWLVTIDELADRAVDGESGRQWDLTMTAKVNGIEVSRGNVRDMNWTFGQILARASYGVTLQPGDVVGSGTCGTGCFLELNGSKITNDQWLQLGDRIELAVDGLGTLSNSFVAEKSDGEGWIGK